MSRSRESAMCALIVALLMFMMTGRGYAQGSVVTATLKGMVTDPSKAYVKGATVSVRSLGQGVNRQTTTNELGEYRLSLLNPGEYEVTVEAAGFQTNVVAKVSFIVGQVYTHNVQLIVKQLEQRFVVTDQTPLIEPERTQQSNIIEKKQIESLPNLNRAYADYFPLLPAINDIEAARLQNSGQNPQRNSGFSIGGGNGRLNTVTIDGGDNELGTGALRIRRLSVEAIQEFEVNRNAFAAEFGFTTGTAINAITKSGGNQLHGGAYAFYRSQKLAARNPLDFSLRKPFEQRVFPGFSLGGPIRANQAFFFTSYEAYLQDDAAIRPNVADSSLLGLTQAQESYLGRLMSGPLATDRTRQIAAILRGGLSPANSPQSMQLLQSNLGSFTLPSNTHTWTTRFDYQPGGANNYSGRFTLFNENLSVPSPDITQSFDRTLLEKERDYTMFGTWNHVFDEGLFNQLRIQYVKNRVGQLPFNPLAPSTTVQGVISQGPQSVAPVSFFQDRFQIDDVLAWTRGRHNFKFGFSYRPSRVRVESGISFTGIFQFSAGLPLTLPLSEADQAVLTGPLAPGPETALTSLQAYSINTPVAWYQAFGNGNVSGFQNTLSFFEQDSWKVTPRLTLDYGLRIEYEGEPAPINRSIYLAPRLGFAWDARGDGKTVVRGGGGVYFAPVALTNFAVARLLNEREDRYIGVIRTLLDGDQSSAAIWGYGLGLGKLPNRALSQTDVENFGIVVAPGQPKRELGSIIENYQNPYSVQASLGASRLIGRNLTVEVAYQFYRGVHLPLVSETNYRETGQNVQIPGSDLGFLFGPQLAPIDPTIGSKIIFNSWGNSVYHGVSTSVTQRFGRFSQFSANYTFSKSIDDGQDTQANSSSYLPQRRFLDRGLSAFDLRHKFVVYGVFETPFTSGAGRPWYSRALADLSLSPILTMRSGFPFNLYVGSDTNGDGIPVDRPFFAPRNSGQGPNFYSLNLRLNKRIFLANTGKGSATEGLRVEVIAEAANLLNRTNFLRVNDVICGGPGTLGDVGGCNPRFLTGPFDFSGRSDVPGTAPLGFTAAAPGRQIQFGLKLVF
jgi:hypothetical protein